jgi:hypothetical protein
VIGGQQAPAPGDNPVPVVVGVAGKGDLEAILQADQPLHRIGRGWIHADLTVPIHSHKPEGRVDGLVHDREVQPVALGNRPPVVDPCAAERIDPQVDLRAANGVHVEHVGEIVNVRIEIVVPVGRGGAKSFLEGNPLHTFEAILEKLVGLRLDPGSDGGFRRSAVWGVVFEPAVMRRIVRRRDDDAVGESRLAPAVVSENRVGDNRRWGIFIPLRDHDFHPVCRQDLERTGKGRLGEGMRVHAEKQRAIDLLLLPIQTNGLTDGEDMPFIKSPFEGGTAMPGGAEGNPLSRHRRVRRFRIVGRDEFGYVH